jgi:hypothetical protein
VLGHRWRDQSPLRWNTTNRRLGAVYATVADQLHFYSDWCILADEGLVANMIVRLGITLNVVGNEQTGSKGNWLFDSDARLHDRSQDCPEFFDIRDFVTCEHQFREVGLPPNTPARRTGDTRSLGSGNRRSESGNRWLFSRAQGNSAQVTALPASMPDAGIRCRTIAVQVSWGSGPVLLKMRDTIILSCLRTKQVGPSKIDPPWMDAV